MAEYIDREKIEYENWQGVYWANPIAVVRKCSIDSMPVADVAPVVHGEWLDRRGGFFDFAACSNCKEEYPLGGDTLNYCPNCGAKMDGAVNE